MGERLARRCGARMRAIPYSCANSRRSALKGGRVWKWQWLLKCVGGAPHSQKRSICAANSLRILLPQPRADSPAQPVKPDSIAELPLTIHESSTARQGSQREAITEIQMHADIFEADRSELLARLFSRRVIGEEAGAGEMALARHREGVFILPRGEADVITDDAKMGHQCRCGNVRAAALTIQ